VILVLESVRNVGAADQLSYCKKDNFFELMPLYRAAFPDEDLVPLIVGLSALQTGVFSIAASSGEQICGHIMWTLCDLEGSRETLALLGPLAVMPDWQRLGVGSGLINQGFQHLKSLGIAQVMVLGDPAYYGRFGFKPDRIVLPPYPMPHSWLDAWQSVRLDDRVYASGRLILPEIWLRPSLWLPESE
jgi:putative acetyltransferase